MSAERVDPGGGEAATDPEVTVSEVVLAHGIRGVVIEDATLQVTVLPDNGADLLSIVERRNGVDVLFRTPWGLLPLGPSPAEPDSASRWLRRYAGGWQVLIPNGGGPAAMGGTTWGFHGEAAVVPWAVRAVTGGIDAEVTLLSAPLRVERELRLVDGAVRITEQVTNTAPDPVAFMWSHHPAFGAPLVAPGSRIAVGARTFVADDEQPGSGIAPGSRHTWPLVSTQDGGTLDLSVVDGEDRSIFGYLTDIDDPWFALVNPQLELGVTMSWSRGVLGHAWFWQERHASRGWPWFRRAYVAAIEPASTIPGQGAVAAVAKGGRLVELAGGASAQIELWLRVVHDGRVPAAIGAGAVPLFD